MAQWRPDPTFYPSPKMAMQAPAEKLAFVAMLNPTHTGKPDALASAVVPVSFLLTAGAKRPAIEVAHRDGVQRWLV